MWVPCLRPFPGNEAHNFFSGGPKWGDWGGGKEVYVEKVYVPFSSPNLGVLLPRPFVAKNPCGKLP